MASPRSLLSRPGARQVAAEGVDGHRIGAVEAAHEIGDGVFGVNEAAIHEVAGVEQHKDVGADEGVGTGIEAGLAGRPLSAAISGRVVPSSLTCSGGLLPSAKVASFCAIPSSRIRKSLGFRPLM